MRTRDKVACTKLHRVLSAHMLGLCSKIQSLTHLFILLISYRFGLATHCTLGRTPQAAACGPLAEDSQPRRVKSQARGDTQSSTLVITTQPLGKWANSKATNSGNLGLAAPAHSTEMPQAQHSSGQTGTAMLPLATQHHPQHEHQLLFVPDQRRMSFIRTYLLLLMQGLC